MKNFDTVWNDKKNKAIIIISLIILSQIIQLVMCAILTDNSSFIDLLKHLNHYDSYHYKRIISNGYASTPINIAGEANWAFFPLFPMIIRAIYLLTNAHIELIAFIVNSIFLFGAIIYGTNYMKITGCNSQSQLLLSVFLTLGCYSFYNTLIYTEALSLFLLTFCLYQLEKKQYIKLGIAGMLFSMARNIGIFIEFVILVKWIMDYCENKEDYNNSFYKYFLESLNNLSLVFCVSIIPAGFFSYVLYLYQLTGDGLAFLHVQYGWGRENSFFLSVFLKGIKEITGHGSYLAIWSVIGVWITIITIFKYRKYHEAILCFISIFFSMQSALDSIPRYMFGVFVFYKTTSLLISDSKWYNKLFLITFILFYELVLINGWIMGEGVLT